MPSSVTRTTRALMVENFSPHNTPDIRTDTTRPTGRHCVPAHAG
jgi:hypothetical protein